MHLHPEANLLFEKTLDAEAALLLLFRAQGSPAKDSGTWEPPLALPHADYLEADFKCQKGFKLFWSTIWWEYEETCSSLRCHLSHFSLFFWPLHH